MKLALLQVDTVWHAPAENLAQAEVCLRKAAAVGSRAALLPEMFATGFSMDVARAAEPENGPVCRAVAGLARQYCIDIVAGIAVRSGPATGKNMAAVFNTRGEVCASYTKAYPFTLVSEQQYFPAGDRALVCDLAGVPATVAICYDLRFPELFRSVARQVLLVCVLANWPAARSDHWETLLRARAIENQCFVAGVNRVGRDPAGRRYAGGSMVVDPWGRVVCRAGTQATVLTADIDPQQVRDLRHQYPFLADMRDLRTGSVSRPQEGNT